MERSDNNEEIIKALPSRIVSMPLKKNFKIWLDSNVATSWTGTQFDAKFFVDFNQCIRETWRLNSSYRMTFSFISKASTFAVGGVTSTNTYTLHIDLGQGTPTMYRYTSVRTPSGIVRVDNAGSGVWTVTAGVADVPVYFNARPADNEGVFINNLKGVSTIALNLIQVGTGTFNSADNAGINTATKYVCCLNFQEL
jgi:hypothetical protein